MIVGRVYNQTKSFDTSTNLVTLESEPVHLRKGQYEGDFATFTWPIEDRVCTTTLEKIYEGRGKEIVPKRANFNSQILVNSHFHRITFGLDLKGTEQKCGHTVFKTQLSNIFVIIGKGNFMQKVEHERYV